MALEEGTRGGPCELHARLTEGGFQVVNMLGKWSTLSVVWSIWSYQAPDMIWLVITL